MNNDKNQEPTRLKPKQAPLEDWQKLAVERLEGWQRERADFENYRKQTAKMKAEFISFATAGLVEKLTPVLRNFTLALKHIPKAEGNKEIENWLQGVLQIQKEFWNVLSEAGVQEISPKKGDKFDPNLHEAVSDGKAEGVKPGAVADCVEQGYALNGRLIKPAKVIIVK